MADLTKIDQKYINYTHAKIDATPITISEQQKTFKVDDINFVDDDIFILECQKDKKWVFSHEDDEESKENGGSIAN